MKHKNKQFPRLMALFLTVMLLLGMFPGSVFAAEPETAPSTAATTETTAPSQPPENPSEAATVPSETIHPTEELTKPTEDVTIPAETTEPLAVRLCTSLHRACLGLPPIRFRPCRGRSHHSVLASEARLRGENRTNDADPGSGVPTAPIYNRNQAQSFPSVRLVGYPGESGLAPGSVTLSVSPGQLFAVCTESHPPEGPQGGRPMRGPQSGRPMRARCICNRYCPSPLGIGGKVPQPIRGLLISYQGPL